MATQFIMVSIEIMHDKNLTPNQKFILAEIHQLSMLDKGCIATNKHFSDLIGIKVQGVSNAINDLQKKGYINIDNSNTVRNNGRVITIHENVSPIHSDVSPIHSDVESKENRTKNITTNKTKEAILLPEWLSVSAWNQWVEYRKEIKKKLTPSTIKQQIKLLEKNKDSHIEIIEQSIQNGWTGLFKIKAPINRTYNKQPEVGSIAWRMQQKTNNVDVEVIDVSA